MLHPEAMKVHLEYTNSIPYRFETDEKSLEASVNIINRFNSLVVLVARLELARTYKVPRILRTAFSDLSTIINVDNYFYQNHETLETRRVRVVLKTWFQTNTLCLRSNQKHRYQAPSIPIVYQALLSVCSIKNLILSWSRLTGSHFMEGTFGVHQWQGSTSKHRFGQNQRFRNL